MLEDDIDIQMNRGREPEPTAPLTTPAPAAPPPVTAPLEPQPGDVSPTRDEYRATHPNLFTGGGGAPAPGPAAAPPPRPVMPPLGAGTFTPPAAPYGAGAPFRTSEFFRNRFVSGGTGGGTGRALPIGAVAGGSPLGPGAGGGEAGEQPVDPEVLRRIFAQILGRG